MDRKIRIAYFDLGFSKEEYGLLPTRYGGGAVAARYLKEESDIDFVIFAPPESFSNVGSIEARARCVSMGPEVCEALKRGYPLSEFMGEGKPYQAPDIILHPHTCETLNRGTLKCPVVHFCGFDGTAGHPGNDYVLLYDDSFAPKFGEKPKYVRIGKPVPSKYIPYPKASYIFQCSRHDNHMNSLETARQCRRFGIQGYFAGPIHGDYPLMKEIDGKTTHYLGEIDEPTKLGFCRHASIFALPLQWDAPFNQSIIEAQGLGTPIWATKRGPFLSKYIKEGVNGWDASRVTLLEAINTINTLNQEDCWKAAREYDVSVMVTSFKRAFQEIAAEWSVRS